jgi:phage terminase large subunit-like protein
MWRPASKMAHLIDVLRPDQRGVVLHPAKRKFLACGRRWGKTVLGGCDGLDWAVAGARVAWIVPTYRNSRALWRMATRLAPALGGEVKQADLLIEFGHGFLGVYSADNADAIRGESFHKVLIDEAARIKEDVYYDVLEATVADTGGEITAISTPRGRNWFWREHARGLDEMGDVASWSFPTSANPLPLVQAAVLKAKERLPDRTFRQEWLAEFIEDSGGLFRNVDAAATAANSHPSEHNGHGGIALGVDWGKSEDFTVIAGVCRGCRTHVVFDRFNRIDYALQRQRLGAIADRWKPDIIWAESNAMGEPIIEELRRSGLPVKGFQTTAVSKPPLMESLALAIEKGELRILPNTMLLAELKAIEITTSPTGHVRYAAPAGFHDDTVIALALAWHGAKSSGGFLMEAI